MKFINYLKNNILESAKKNDYQYSVYGILSLAGFIGFYFANPAMIAPAQYENFYVRLVAIILCFILIIRNYWPNSLKKFLPIYWCITLTYNCPFFFTFMLLHNKWSIEWQLNWLISLAFFNILTNFSALCVLVPTGTILAYLCCNFSMSHLYIPENISAISSTCAAFVIFCAIFNYRKDNFYHERLKFQQQIKGFNDALKQNVNMLQETLAAKTEFLNNINHKIITPVANFLDISESLYSNWHKYDDKERYHHMGQVTISARGLSKLVGTLLDLAKFNHGNMLLHVRNIDLKEIIDNIVEESKILCLNGNNIEFKVKNYCSSTIITADYEKITHVLRNLFSNSAKYSPDDSVIIAEINEAEITQNDGRKEAALHFTLIDQGAGIAESELEYIFEPFIQSTRTNTATAATGIELSICHKILVAHRGKIWAENNQDGIGSSFHFIIPRK